MAATHKGDHVRVEYLDTLRVLATCAVIVVHATWALFGTVSLGSKNWHVLNVYDSTVRFCAPIFFMVSGALFLDPNRPMLVSTIWHKYILRIVVAYVAWVIPYAFVDIYRAGSTLSLSAFVERIIVAPRHLWFLPVIAGLYAMSPLLRAITAHRDLARYFIWLSVSFGTIAPLLTELPRVGPWLDTALINANVQMVSGYSLYFVLGYMIHTSTRAVPAWRLGLLLVVSIAVTAMGTALASVEAKPSAVFYSYLTPNVLAASVAVFWLVKQRSRHIGRLAKIISRYSFGIYLTHFLVLYAVIDSGITRGIAPALAVPLNALIILLCSLTLTLMLRNIPKIGRFVT